MKCDHCGNEITENYGWVSIHEELDGKTYCSHRCCELEALPIVRAKEQKRIQEYFTDIIGAFSRLEVYFEDTEEWKEYLEDYPHIYEKIKWLQKVLNEKS